METAMDYSNYIWKPLVIEEQHLIMKFYDLKEKRNYESDSAFFGYLLDLETQLTIERAPVESADPHQDAVLSQPSACQPGSVKDEIDAASDSEDGEQAGAPPDELCSDYEAADSVGFNCPICDKLFANNDAVKTHLRKIHGLLDGQPDSQNQNSPRPEEQCATCDVCGKSFSSELTLRRHKDYVHNRELNYGCKTCGKVYFRRDNLRLHEYKHEKIDENCKICDKRFTNKLEMVRHKRVCGIRGKTVDKTTKRKQMVPLAGSFQCAICTGKVFDSSRKLLLHFGNEHPANKPIDSLEVIEEHEKFSCRLCKDVKFATALEQVAHFRQLHAEEDKPFNCPVCPSRFAENVQLRHHKNIISHDAYDCKECGKVISGRKQRYLDHLGWHKGDTYECEICKKILLNRTSLRDHKRIMHDRLGIKKRYVCELCGKKLSNTTEYKDHRRTHEGHVFKCELCSKQLASRSSVRYHMKTQHSDEPNKFACKICGKTTKTSGEMKKHTRIHENRTKDFSCNKCEKKYYNERELNKHLMMHNNIRNYVCTICSKAFVKQEVLKRHERIHTDDRPFKCELCPSDFKFSASLYTHVKQKHEGQKRKQKEQQQAVDKSASKVYSWPANFLYQGNII